MAQPTSVGYNFNSIQEFRSHSAVLFNERMAILFYMLDLEGIKLNSGYSPGTIMQVRALLKQIYKNIRMVIRTNPAARAILNLDTEHAGVYTTDVQLGYLDRMIEYCEMNGYNYKYMHIIINELNSFEMIIKDVLQYFSYFIRPDYRQKPDVEMATERYKEIADKKTVEDLKLIIGKRHQIDFNGLGTKRVELTQEDEFEGLELREPEMSKEEQNEDNDDNYSEDEKWKNA